MPAQWQIRFDNGHQQRYLPDRQAVLRYVLAVGLKAASPRFEVFHESDPVVLSDGSPGGRAFSLVEIIDLAAARRGRTAAGGTVRGWPAGSPAAGNAVTGHAATGRAAMTGPGNGKGLEPGSRTIIPLMAGVARPRGERRVLMREAVVEVVGHLVLKAVPPARALTALRPGPGPADRSGLGARRTLRGGS